MRPVLAIFLLSACGQTLPLPDESGLDFPSEEPALCQWPASDALPAAPVLPRHPDVIDHGPRSQMKVALTFDACPTKNGAVHDDRIQRILVEQGVPATIFVSGRWAKGAVDYLQALANQPLFELGNHSYAHPHLTRLSDQRIREELSMTQLELTQLTGVVPALFRPPYGEYDDRVVQIARSMGLWVVEYDLPSGDPSGASRQALVQWVVQRAQPGSIVVMHLNHPRFHTADALPAIISGLRARGFELVKVSELIRARNALAMASRSATRPPEQKLGHVRHDKTR